jgi:hypothetical protein
MTTISIDTDALVRLVRALEQQCECEQGLRREDCNERLNRWWRRLLLDQALLAGEYAPDARRSA